MIPGPWTLLGGAIGWALSLAAAAWWAYGAGQDHVIATQAREDAAVERAVDAALKTSAEVLAGIEVSYGPTREVIQREVRERPVYRDCAVTPDGLRALNEAILGRPEPAGGGGVPSTDAPARPEHGRAAAEGR